MHGKKFLTMILSACMIATGWVPGYAAETENDETVYLNYQFEKNAESEIEALRKATQSRYANFATSAAHINSEDGKLVFTGFANGSAASYMTIPKIVSDDSASKEAVLEYKVKLIASVSQFYLGYDSTRFQGDTNFVHTNSSGVAWKQTDANAKNYVVKSDVYGGLNAWHTFAVKYSNTEHTRTLYIDGVEYGTNSNDGAAADNYWFDKGMLQFTFKLYNHKTAADKALFEYIKIYSPAESVGFNAYSGSYDLNTVNLDFNTTITTLSPEMITVNGEPALDVYLVDDEEQIYTVVLENALQPSTEYEVCVDGAIDSIARTVNSASAFTTREKAFYINNIRVENDFGKLEALSSGDATLYANAVNECVSPESFTFYALQYDGDGYMNKDNVFSRDYTAEENPVNISEELSISENSEKLSVFALRSEEVPVPVSGAVNYNTEGVEESPLTYNIGEYEGNAEANIKINDDYSGVTVTVDIKDETDRAVGLIAKYKGNTEYIAYGKTADGTVSFNLPLREEMVGEYSFVYGVEGGSEAIDGGTVEYYSPAFTERMIAECINSENATCETVAEFVSALGGYLKLDIEGLEMVDDDSYVYSKVLDIRDSKEGNEFSSHVELADAFSLAIKLARIYEGNGTEGILAKGTEIGIDEQTVNTFSGLISDSARAYVSEKLKGTDYSDLSVLAESVKKYAIVGGLYKASHYSLADTFIGIYGEEAGINVSAYKSLRYPEKVAKKIIGTEYESITDFGDAVKVAVTAQARAEASQSSGSSGGGGGGGGGSRISGTTYTPDKKEDVKEEIKEEKPIKSYSDVKVADWFYNDVMWATGEGLFIGTSETTFAPSMNLTWEQIAIVLGRIGHTLDNKNGSEDILRGDFAEVLYNFLADKTQYKTRDEWISGTKIFIGDQNGDMMFEKTLTRAECCTVLRRISK